MFVRGALVAAVTLALATACGARSEPRDVAAEPLREGEPPRLCGRGAGGAALGGPTESPDSMRRDGDVVVIAMSDELEPRMRTAYMDLKDLNVAVRRFDGVTLNLDDAPSNGSNDESGSGRDPETLLDAIRAASGGPEAWAPPASLDFGNGIVIAHNHRDVLARASEVVEEMRRVESDDARLRVTASHLAEMQTDGTAAEHAWARAALRDAPTRLRAALSAALLRRGDAVPTPAGGGAIDPHRVRVGLRVVDLTPGGLRDLGIDLSNSVIERTGVRSWGQLLDETQAEVLDRALEKGLVGRTVDEGPVWFWNGESREVSAGTDGVLRLRPIVSRDARFLHVRVSLSFRIGGDILFLPTSEVVIPCGGTLLVVAADHVTPGDDLQGHDLQGHGLLVSVEVDP